MPGGPDPSLPIITPGVGTPGSPGLPTLAPTPTPTPTPEPAMRIESGDRALFNGDWDTALREYQLVYDAASDPYLQSAALLGLGRTHFQIGNYGAALDALRSVVENYQNSSSQGFAFFALGQVYDALARYSEAVDAYTQYLALRPGQIDSYVHEQIGDSHSAAGDYINAISAYQAALQVPHLGDGLSINIKIGNIYALLGDYNTAIVTYQDVYNRTSSDYTKAQMDLSIGQAYNALGQPEQAYAVWLEAVENYPLSYDSYIALVSLVDAGVPVSELDRGLVDYFAGEYSVALMAFDRYLLVAPDDHTDTVHYYRGLALYKLGDYQGAIDEFDVLIQTHVRERYWADAYDEKAFTQWAYLNQYTLATETLIEFVSIAPDHAQAPELLYYAGRIAERNFDLTLAAQIWERTGIDYPTSNYGYDGFFQAGIALYRNGNFLGAEQDFRSALGLAASSGDQARGYFWIGKAQFAANDSDGAAISWQTAAAIDPTGYYSERANDILAGRQAFTPGRDYTFSYDHEAEKVAAEVWLMSTFGLPPETNLNSLDTLMGDSRFTRGAELWELGLYNPARLEFESLRLDVQYDPANTYRLANYFIDLGLYRSGINAARQVLNLAGMDDAGTMSAPVYFNRLRFGAYFPELVLPASQAYGFDAMFLYSVMRQESLFEGFVVSTAGARGLMQIMPGTGQGIANRAGWPPDYTAEDLYRPLVSSTFGADYLSVQLNSFDGDLFAALAAYNGGPGNAAIWFDLAAGDQDLFVEVVRFQETRNYLRGIYEIYTIYRNLYAPPL